MNQRWHSKWRGLLLVASILAFAFAGCEESEDQEPEGSGPNRPTLDATVEDTTPDPPDQDTTTPPPPQDTTQPPPGECPDFQRPAQVGTTCQTAESCPGGACASTEAGQPPVCYPLCSPNQCTDACVSGEVCVPLQGQDGQPLVEDGLAVGACIEPPSGTQGAYDECSQTAGLCASGLSCVVLQAGAQSGICLPTCAGPGSACPGLAPADAQCAAQLEDGTAVCIPICDAATNNCPASHTCTTVQGGSICVPN